MEPDRLPAHLRRVLDAAQTLDERILVLLFARKAEPAPELAELLPAERAETMTALGRLSHAGLVAHNRPEGEPIHWFATREGRTRGEQLLRAIAARLVAQAPAQPAPATDEQPVAEPVEPPEHQQVKTRRRVPIDQNEKTGFSWD
jgi:hypothetical protein